MTIDRQDFDFVRDLLHERSGVALDSGKGYLVEARLTPVAEKAGFASIRDLVSQLRQGETDSLHAKVVEALTTNETLFFRDVHPFHALRSSILPELIEKRSTQRRLNVWCAAAASGQEPYSLAMVLAEHFPQLASWDVRLIASDISDAVLERAARGTYSQLEVNRGLPAPMLVKYFRQEGNDWQVSDEILRRVEFRNINLSEEWPPLPPMDVVFMRNVLIYFNPETKKTILGKVRQILRPDGYLFLGSAETTINLDSKFKRVEFDRTVVYALREPMLAR
jgi:chemotaxis protein methyltransferase CheR